MFLPRMVGLVRQIYFPVGNKLVSQFPQRY